MCLDCGCLSPADDHDSPVHITLADLQAAANESGLPLAEAAANIPRTLITTTGQSWPPAEQPLAGRPAVVFDCDGVLAFTAEALCTALNARFGTTYSPMSQAFFPGTLITSRLPAEQAAWAGGMFRDEAFLEGLAPDWHALDTLTDLHDAGYEVLVVTERPPETGDVTTEWLASWGAWAAASDMHAVGPGGKPEFLNARFGPGQDAVLLDDNPAAQLTCAREGLQVWAPERPYTPLTGRDHVRVFPNWNTARYWLGLPSRP